MAADARCEDDTVTCMPVRLVGGATAAASRRPRSVTVALAVGCCLHGFAASSIATAVPAIGRSLHAGLSGGEAPVTSFFLGAALGVVAAGRVADVFGARRLLLVGLGVVVLATLGSGLAVTLPELVVARLVIGAGTASVYPAAIKLLADANTARGLVTTASLPAIVAASELMFGIGPAAGGALVTVWGWRIVCMVLAIPAVVAILLVRHAFPSSAENVVAAPGAARLRTPRRQHMALLDLGGLAVAVGLAGMAAALLIVPVRLSSPTVVLPTVTLVLAAVLVVHSRRHPSPTVDLKVLCSSPIRLGLARTTIVYAGVYSIVYGLPLWLAAQGWTAEQSGAALLPIALVSVGSVAVFRNAVRARGPVPALLTGAAALLLAGIGLLTVPAFAQGGTTPAVLGVLGLLGVTCGAANLATQHGTVAASPLTRTGGVASWSRLVQFLAGQGTTVVVVQALPGTDTGLRGLAVGVAVLGALLAATAAISPDSPTRQGEVPC